MCWLCYCSVAFERFFLYTNAPSTLEKRECDFSVKNTKNITRVVLTDQKGRKLELKKNEQLLWIVNGTYEANDEALGLLFSAIQKIVIRGSVRLNGVENVLRDLLKKHSRIEIYASGDKPIKVYYVGGPTLDNLGTYMIMEVDGNMAKRPYITYIPGVDAYLTSRYNTDSLYWRTRWVYRTRLPTLKPVAEQKTQRRPTNSFYINKNAAGQFEIENYKHEKRKSTQANLTWEAVPRLFWTNFS